MKNIRFFGALLALVIVFFAGVYVGWLASKPEAQQVRLLTDIDFEKPIYVSKENSVPAIVGSVKKGSVGEVVTDRMVVARGFYQRVNFPVYVPIHDLDWLSKDTK
jgi:hypothetical protein